VKQVLLYPARKTFTIKAHSQQEVNRAKVMGGYQLGSHWNNCRGCARHPIVIVPGNQFLVSVESFDTARVREICEVSRIELFSSGGGSWHANYPLLKAWQLCSF
jgi:hypothetical protein